MRNFLLTFILLAMSAISNATLIVEIDAGADGTIDFSAVDGGANDFNPLPGMLSVIAASVGDSVFTIGAFSGAPDLGELFDINFLTTLAENSTWEIRIADDNYLLGDVLGATALSLVTPTTINHAITVETRVDGQTILATSPLVGGVNQSAVATIDLIQPTTIEHIITLTSTAAGMTSTFDTRTAVLPEPSTAGLFGAGLLALGFMSRRRRATTA